MASVMKQVLQGFSQTFSPAGRLSGMLARRRAFTRGKVVGAMSAKKAALRHVKLQQFGKSAKKVGGWAAVLAALGALVLTTTRGDQISEFLTGHKSDG